MAFPPQVTARPAELDELREIDRYLSEFCRLFGYDIDEILSAHFTVVTQDGKNPYRQMYVAN